MQNDNLKKYFPKFAAFIKAQDIANDQPPKTLEEITALEQFLKVTLPISYKQFLSCTSGLRLDDLALEISNPFIYEFAPLSQMPKRGTIWPPSANGMLCFGDYFKQADGDQIYFDVSKGLINNKYPVMYYAHNNPNAVLQLSINFYAFLEEYVIAECEALE